MTPVLRYISEISEYFSDPNSSEMSYRTPFQVFLETIFPQSEGFRIQHDPKAIKGNKPDFIILKNDVPLLYIEVKKVGEDLNKIENSSQADRYFGYTNLILSDYLEFRFYRNGERYDDSISLGQIDKAFGTLDARPDVGERLARTMRDFVAGAKEPIKRGSHLAKIMGGKAQRIRDNVIAFLGSEKTEKNELEKMMSVIKEHLVANLTVEDFADMYAQTLVYGLFAARYSDETLGDFSRQEARELVPATNPFLRRFFDHISGESFPKRFDIIVSELCEVFSHADVRALMDQYFKQTDLFDKEHESPDPVIHFYEDFLYEYDPQKKVEMGVFYTPLPVVRFIVRGIDELIKREFGLLKGLSDNSKISREVILTDSKGKTRKVTDDSFHRVQVLDVAVGTGTFLNETITHIFKTFEGNEGKWIPYVENELLPRLHGFELMMASYTIAHLKLAMTLKKTGVSKFGKRLGVYLSNTLDTPHEIELQGNLFGFLDSIAEESKLASQVKQDYPIMVVMGNPPYSGESMNPHYTGNDVYKVEPGGKERLQERNSKWLNDDYVKFIRFGESMIENNGEGIVSMITAHGYLDNPTFRGMRWHLRQTFDSIYVLNLHGSANKKETAPDGGKDGNVFDIKTGVSIIFGIKKRTSEKNKKQPATLYHKDFYGTRANKFELLDKSSIENIEWNVLPGQTDIWKVEGEGKEEYMKGFSVADLFLENTVGMVTGRDAFVIDSSREKLTARIEDFLSLDAHTAKTKHNLRENQTWKISHAQKHLFDEQKIIPVAYRPFDIQYVYYDKDFIERSREKVMKNFFDGENLGLVFARSQKNPEWNAVFVSKYIIETKLGEASTQSAVAPLYLYLEDGTKVPNLKTQIVGEIERVVGKTSPEEVFDYIYAILHSPNYRKKYGEFLKIDFPRVPQPKDSDSFKNLCVLGRELRLLHLLESPLVEEKMSAYLYPKPGSNTIEKPVYKDRKVFINKEQYFNGISEAVWNFYIGGYQPAQKWLKDRKGQMLSNADIEHYQKMIVALAETERVMGEIDKIM